ncbi:Alpha/Beta hydrolase protein [Xylariomycetidae sp. FL2044]|nr:Alpha/Beta hydrolase protein [Xylariomycetidae sp. FL2044]
MVSPSQILLAGFAASAAAGWVKPPTATISAGAIIGTSTAVPSTNVTVNKFLGIPYAAPPVGSLRFALPQPPESWANKTPLNATGFRNACMQMGASSGLLVAQSEDCLYLNVFAPSSSSPLALAGRPVLVWIHGGALKTGSAAIATYDGTSFAANQGVVLVSINYRLNAFGLSNAPALPLADRNVAFWDQRAALNWVRQNIAAFGGDREQVTVFGQSSGSTSVSRLVSTIAATAAAEDGDPPPFRAAIMQSGVYDYGYESGSLSNIVGVDAWKYLVQSLGCASSTNSSSGNADADSYELACVRGVDATAIQSVLDGNADLDFTGANDNVTQYAYPERAREEGRVAQVAIMLGNTADDASYFTDASFTTLDAYLAAYPNLAYARDVLAAAYPVVAVAAVGDEEEEEEEEGGGGSGYATQWEANAASRTDDLFTCAISRVAGATMELGLPVWRYVFNATFPDTEDPGYGVYHSADVPLVFGTYDASTAGADEVALSRAMQTAWADFAKDPFGKGPGWTRAAAAAAAAGSGANGTYAVAALGSPGRNRTGAAVISSSLVDANCGIYDASYEEGQGGVAWW